MRLNGGSSEFSWLELSLGFGPGMIGEICVAAILFGGIVLISKRLIHWEIPLIFISILLVASWLWGLSPKVSLLSGSAFFAAFYIVTDPVTTPLTRRGMQVFAIATACLLVIMRLGTPYFYVLPFAILIMNALTPWIDASVKPRNIKLVLR